MPAYGNALNPSETLALTSFLKTLHRKDLTPAIDASRSLVHSSELQVPVLPGNASTGARAKP